MVKNAYEDILGFDKEALVTEVQLFDEADKDPELARLYAAALDGKPGANAAFNKKFHNFAITERMKDVAEHYDKKNRIRGPINNIKMRRAFERQNPNANPTDPNYNKVYRDFAMDWEKNRLDKKWAGRHLGKKAAAYYDEAQYVKEAAEADYAEACAYEDAAIQILDELGYLD